MTFPEWYKEFTGVSIGYAEKQGMSSDTLKAAWDAGCKAGIKEAEKQRKAKLNAIRKEIEK